MTDDTWKDTWKDYGNWYPTAQLRWNHAGELEQVWRRNYEQRWGGGIVMGGNGHEEEWRVVPRDPGQGALK